MLDLIVFVGDAVELVWHLTREGQGKRAMRYSLMYLVVVLATLSATAFLLWRSGFRLP